MFDKKVSDFLGLVSTKGTFGIEIEMEIDSLIKDEHVEPWSITIDHSLRGYAYEFVLDKPVDRCEVGSSVQCVKKYLVNHNLSIYDSVRAAVHIHINMQESTVRDMYRFLMVYYPLETLLLKNCGSGREGNLFCLGARDAMYTTELLKRSIIEKDIYQLRTSQLRYSSMNFQSLFTFGSIEFRSIKTKPHLDNIEFWCDVLQSIKDYSENINNCWDSIGKISGLGPDNWAREVLGDELFTSLYYNGAEGDIISDTRNIQHLSYIMSENGI